MRGLVTSNLPKPIVKSRPFGGGLMTEITDKTTEIVTTVIDIGSAEYRFTSKGYDADPAAYRKRLEAARRFFGLADSIVDGFTEEMRREDSY